MFDVTVGRSEGADFTTFGAAMEYYRTMPWWKRKITALFPACVEVENGYYPEHFSLLPGVGLVVGIKQRMVFNISGDGELEIRRL